MNPILIQVQNLLGFENQQKIITSLGDVNSTIIDTVFPPAKRNTNPSPMLKLNQLNTPVKAIALTRRGDGPQRVDDITGSAGAFEPYPINPYRSMTGSDLNNWRVWNNDGREKFISRMIDLNRKTIRLTTEAMASQVFSTGSLNYPINVDGVFTGKYKITFGTIATITVSTLWSATGAKHGDVFKVLVDIRKQIQTSGYGSTIKYLAGETAFYALVNFVATTPNDKRFPAQVKEGVVIFAGNEIRLCSESYTDPESGSLVKKIPDTTVIGYAEDAPHELIYSSLDDIDSNFIPAPFWTKAVKPSTENNIRIISESKPMPVPCTNAVAKAVVTA